MKVHNPPPPQEIISEDYLKPLDIGAIELADSLDLPVRTVNEILSGDHAIDADTAHRLSIATETTAES